MTMVEFGQAIDAINCGHNPEAVVLEQHRDGLPDYGVVIDHEDRGPAATLTGGEWRVRFNHAPMKRHIVCRSIKSVSACGILTISKYT